jgi:hypothetical protein
VAKEVAIDNTKIHLEILKIIRDEINSILQAKRPKLKLKKYCCKPPFNPSCYGSVIDTEEQYLYKHIINRKIYKKSKECDFFGV